MDAIYEWIRSLAFYAILMTMILNLLPNKKYEKYLRLFTGLVFLMLVLSPFTDITGLEAQIAGAFERLTFQNDAKLLQREIADADGARMNQLVDAYSRALEQDLKVMAEAGNLQCLTAEVDLDTDTQAGVFGKIQAVRMTVGIEESTTTHRRAANREIDELTTKIGEYYGLEKSDIEIRLEAE